MLTVSGTAELLRSFDNVLILGVEDTESRSFFPRYLINGDRGISALLNV